MTSSSTSGAEPEGAQVAERPGPVRSSRARSRQPPPPGVGRQQVVAHLEDHVGRGGVPAPRQSAGDVDDPYPQRVLQPRAGPPGVGQLVEQRVIDRAPAQPELHGQVPAQQVGSQRGAGRGVGGDHFAYVQHAVGQRRIAVPAVHGRVERVAARAAAVLGQHAVQRAGALPPVRRVVHRSLPPRLGPRDEAGPRRQDRVVDLGQLGDGRHRIHEPQPQAAIGRGGPGGRSSPGDRSGPGQRALAPVEGEVGVPHRAAVAEPGVDHRLRGPQHGQRLAAVPDVGQLPAHQAGQHAPASVRGQHAHPRHAGRGQRRGPGHGELEGVGTRGADRRVAVEGGQAAVELQVRQDQLPFFRGQRGAVEGVHIHGVEGVELLRADRPDRIRVIAAGHRCRHDAFVPRLRPRCDWFRPSGPPDRLQCA